MVSSRSYTTPPIRSISLPSRLNPTSLRVESQLNKLRSWELMITSSPKEEHLSGEMVQTGLVALAELYNSMGELIHSSFSTQQEAVLEESVDDSVVNLLDTCGIAKDMLTKIKAHAQSLQSSLRRRDEVSFMLEVSAYISFRKTVKKLSGQCIRELRRGERRRSLVGFLPNVVDVLREVNVISSIVFRYMLFFLSASTTATKSKRFCSLMSKLIIRSEKPSETKRDVNEVGSIDEALSKFLHLGEFKDGIQMVQTKLETLEHTMNGLELDLDLVFRRLIRYRASYLNVLTR